MHDHEPRTILVVDDDMDVVSLVAMVLGHSGFKAQTAANGREALAAIEDSMPDLILLDMKMPVMDGWEFASEFRARYGFQVPVVVLTAADDAKKRAEEIGAVGWVGKPFDLDKLVAVVRQFVAR